MSAEPDWYAEHLAAFAGQRSRRSDRPRRPLPAQQWSAWWASQTVPGATGIQLASQQGLVLSTRQLAALGVSRSVVNRAVATLNPAPLRAFLEVEDDGPGIPLSERARVLERFYRGPSGGHDGTGLGLAIVDEIARAHGAALDISVGVDGRGTRVRIEFPATTQGIHP